VWIRGLRAKALVQRIGRWGLWAVVVVLFVGVVVLMAMIVAVVMPVIVAVLRHVGVVLSSW
jgi:hypothetical protein